MELATFADLRARCLDLPAGDEACAEAVRARQSRLTKPPGSLGRLEQLVAWLARWQRREMPRLDRVEALVFAGTHGVTARGVSAYPAEVTAQMVANFSAGGAAINQLARRMTAAPPSTASAIRMSSADRALRATAPDTTTPATPIAM